MGCPKNERVEVFLNEDGGAARRLGMAVPASSYPAKCFVFGRTGTVQEANEELQYVVIYQPSGGESLDQALRQLAQSNPPQPLAQVYADFQNAGDEPFARLNVGASIRPRMCCKCNRNVTVVLAHKVDDGFRMEILEGTRFVKADGSPAPQGKCRKIEKLTVSTSEDILTDCDDPPILE